MPHVQTSQRTCLGKYVACSTEIVVLCKVCLRKGVRGERVSPYITHETQQRTRVQTNPLIFGFEKIVFRYSMLLQP